MLLDLQNVTRVGSECKGRRVQQLAAPDSFQTVKCVTLERSGQFDRWPKESVGFRGSSVSIVTDLRTGQPGFDSRQGQGFFSLRRSV
jgi:hypothetical protein